MPLWSWIVFWRAIAHVFRLLDHSTGAQYYSCPVSLIICKSVRALSQQAIPSLLTHQVLTRCGCTLTCINYCRPLFDANNSCSLVGLEDHLVHEKVHLSFYSCLQDSRYLDFNPFRDKHIGGSNSSIRFCWLSLTLLRPKSVSRRLSMSKLCRPCPVK